VREYASTRGDFMKKEQVVERLLQLTTLLAQSEKELVDAEYAYNKMKHAIQLMESDIAIKFDKKEVTNDIQRKAILNAQLKKEKEQLLECDRKRDLAKVVWNRYRVEYNVLLGILLSDTPNKEMFVQRNTDRGVI
jgi:hypothetical protein